jgi:hypothetical protein
MIFNFNSRTIMPIILHGKTYLTSADLAKLKRRYKKALESNNDCFWLDGKVQVATSYAKYLIEFLEGEKKKKGK